MVNAAVLPTTQPDPTIYPTHDDMGSDSLEVWLRIVLIPLVQSWLQSQNRPLFVGGDQFVYYEQFNPKKCVAPDLYTHPKLKPGTRVASIKTWQIGSPSFVLDIVSTDKSKDYLLSPKRYADAGVEELILYDPDWSARRPVGYLWQVFRRNSAGELARVDATGADQVGSEELGCMLREVEIDGMQRIRLFDFHNRLIPSPEELREAAALRKGKEEAIGDLCELLDIGLTESRRAHLASLDLAGLDTLRAALKQGKVWPE